ncbi:CinA-like protein [Cytospora mali]|uniref:CinA-like protein n=1 Tax=Cytospora mali TaxID=578113 RepID=A0A194UVZ0_CYTMA|nr:CinA-like protein [Valsa mali var. pyri (nom. inval.)]
MAEFPPPALTQAAEAVSKILRDRNETISVAETASGGLISAALLATPGASRIYKGGATLYTLESRIAFAGWTQADIDNYHGPNPGLVAGLAKHIRTTLKSTYTVGESGTAGPTSSRMSPNGQPGYVALAVVGDNGTLSRDLNTGLGGDRPANMVAFAVEALKLVEEFIAKDGLSGGNM